MLLIKLLTIITPSIIFLVSLIFPFLICSAQMCLLMSFICVMAAQAGVRLVTGVVFVVVKFALLFIELLLRLSFLGVHFLLLALFFLLIFCLCVLLTACATVACEWRSVHILGLVSEMGASLCFIHAVSASSSGTW